MKKTLLLFTIFCTATQKANAFFPSIGVGAFLIHQGSMLANGLKSELFKRYQVYIENAEQKTRIAQDRKRLSCFNACMLQHRLRAGIYVEQHMAGIDHNNDDGRLESALFHGYIAYHRVLERQRIINQQPLNAAVQRNAATVRQQVEHAILHDVAAG